MYKGWYISLRWLAVLLNALLRCYGRLFRPRRLESIGKKLAQRLKLDQGHPFYGQVIKQTVGRFQCS